MFEMDIHRGDEAKRIYSEIEKREEEFKKFQ